MSSFFLTRATTAANALAGRMKIGPKLAALIALMVLPTVFAGSSYFGSVNADAQFARAEIAGLDVIRPALLALVDLTDENASLPDLTALKDAAAAQPQWDLGESVAAVEDALGQDSAEARAAAALALETVISDAGNASNLVLDPDLDSYYLMDAIVFELPHAIVTHLAADAAYVDVEGASSASAEALVKENVGTQAVLAGVLSIAGKGIASNVETAIASSADATLAGRLAPMLAFSDALASEAATLESTIQKPAPSEFAMARAAAHEAIEPSLAALDHLLDVRLSRIEAQRNLTLAGIATVTTVALVWAVIVWLNTHSGVAVTTSAVLALARKDLTPQPLPPGRDEFAEIGAQLAVARTQLAESFGRLASASGHVAAAAGQLTSSTVTVNDSANETLDQSQAATKEIVGVQGMLAAVSMSAGDLTSATMEISQTMAAVNASAQQARADLDGAASLAAALGESSNRISESVKSIVDIAAKTRLLALNATIEAARAGDAGRGFAVVASEVQALAQQSAAASVLIGHVAEEQHDEIAKVIDSLSRAATAVATAAEAQATVAAAAEEQTATIAEVTDSITGSAEATTRIADQVSRVESVATGTAGTVNELRHAAEEFDAVARELSHEVEAFTLT